MRSIHWVWLIPLFLITGCASPQKPPPTSDAGDDGQFSMTVGSFIDGKYYSSGYTRRMLEEAPRWPASKDSPPLAPRAAVRAAQAELSKTVGDVKDWKPVSIELSPTPEHARLENSWVYRVQFNGPPRPGPRDNTVTITVFLNGKAVPLQLNEPAK